MARHAPLRESPCSASAPPRASSRHATASSDGPRNCEKRTCLSSSTSGGDLAQRRLEARFGCGFSAFGDGFASTPEIGIGFSDTGLSDTGRDCSLGWRPNRDAGDGGPPEFSFEARRCESADDDTPPAHAIGFRPTALFPMSGRFRPRQQVKVRRVQRRIAHSVPGVLRRFVSRRHGVLAPNGSLNRGRTRRSQPSAARCLRMTSGFGSARPRESGRRQ